MRSIILTSCDFDCTFSGYQIASQPHRSTKLLVIIKSAFKPLLESSLINLQTKSARTNSTPTTITTYITNFDPSKRSSTVSSVANHCDEANYSDTVQRIHTRFHQDQTNDYTSSNLTSEKVDKSNNCAQLWQQRQPINQINNRRLNRQKKLQREEAKLEARSSKVDTKLRGIRNPRVASDMLKLFALFIVCCYPAVANASKYLFLPL